MAGSTSMFLTVLASPTYYLKSPLQYQRVLDVDLVRVKYTSRGNNNPTSMFILRTLGTSRGLSLKERTCSSRSAISQPQSEFEGAHIHVRGQVAT